MVVKNLGNKLIMFEKSTGMTGLFSGNEREILKNYMHKGRRIL